MFSCKSGAVEPIRGLAPEEHGIRFDASGRSLYVASGPNREQRVYVLDLETGERVLRRALAPPDPIGIAFVAHPLVTADGSRCAYSFLKIMSDLYVVDGLMRP